MRCARNLGEYGAGAGGVTVSRRYSEVSVMPVRCGGGSRERATCPSAPRLLGPTHHRPARPLGAHASDHGSASCLACFRGWSCEPLVGLTPTDVLGVADACCRCTSLTVRPARVVALLRGCSVHDKVNVLFVFLAASRRTCRMKATQHPSLAGTAPTAITATRAAVHHTTTTQNSLAPPPPTHPHPQTPPSKTRKERKQGLCDSHKTAP